jgi:asparagine synthase (glutamine-hydrolysing)
VSGFVGLMNRRGAGIDERLLHELTERLVYRGPEGITTRLDGGAGLGHAAFSNTGERAAIFELAGGRLWIAADARLDAREELVARLAAAGKPGLGAEPDPLLMLHAYALWGESMLDDLLGDFAFVIWDGERRRLVAARDRIGVKPLYWAIAGDQLLVSNTLQCLRGHPAVDDRLDESAIADYLLFGYNRHAERTAFAQLRRLPPAHRLTATAEAPPSIDRYWRLRVTEAVHYRRPEEYIDHLDELLQRAVADRLRGNRAAVLMSGGLDSPAVAATARQVLQRRSTSFELQLVTFVYERWAADPEREPARRIAEFLGLPARQVSLDEEQPTNFWGPSAAWSAEPTDMPATARAIRAMAAGAAGMTVALTGQGGDPAFHVTPGDAAHALWHDGPWRAVAAAWRYRRRHGRLPRVGLRTALKRRLAGERATAPLFPPWIEPTLESRLDLRARHAALTTPARFEDAVRPQAAAQLGGGEWSFALEWYDPGMSGFLADFRHPFLDVRLIEYALALPPIPWLVEKDILRRAMGGRLPATVLSRRKAPLPGHPAQTVLRQDLQPVLGVASCAPGLAEFIDIERFLAIARRPQRLRPSEYELVTRPLGLALWLSRLQTGLPRRKRDADETGQRDAATQAIPQARAARVR